MTPSALRASLARLGLTQTGAARLCGVDGRTMRRWLADERAIPEPVVRLLWCLEHHPPLMAALRDRPAEPPSRGGD